MALTVLAVTALMLASAAGATDVWLELRSRHFVVVSSAGPDMVRQVAADLERGRRILRHALGGAVVDPRRPVIVVAVEDEDGLRELLPQFWEKRGQRPIAAYWPGPHAHHLVLRLDTSAELRRRHLVHEYVHLLTRMSVPDVPAWLDEGIAELWSTLVVDGDVLEIGRPAAHQLEVLATDKKAWTPLDQLLAMRRPPTDDSRRLARFYAQSWALTHCLVLGPCLERACAPERPPLAPPGYVAQLRTGADPVEAARRAFGELAALETVVKGVVRTGRFRIVRMEAPEAPASPKEADISRLRRMSPADALAVRAEALLDGERPEAALPLLHEAQALEPDRRPVLEALGRLHFQRNEPALAARWFDRAIATGTATHLAHYYRAILVRALSGEVVGRDHAEGAEEYHLRRAILLDPTFAPAHARLAGVLARDARLSRLIEALMLARRATELEPDDVASWADLGRLLLAVPLCPLHQVLPAVP